MKLSIAATLLAPCIPVLSQTVVAVQDLVNTSDTRPQEALTPSTFKNKAINHNAKRRFSSEIQSVLKNRFSHSMKGRRQCDPTSIDPDVGILSCGKGLWCELSDKSELGGFCQSTDWHSQLRVVQKRSFDAADSSIMVDNYIQCDPNSADLGILDCNEGEICIPDESSAHVGICMQTAGISRSLYTVDDILPLCDPSSGYLYNKLCDCTGINNFTGSGSIICSRDDIPFGSYFTGCDGIMADGSVTYVFANRALTSFMRCYEITIPYYQKFCLTTSYQIGASEADSCSIEFNGHECSSCAITDEFYDFDCSAIDPKALGSTVYELSSILGQCHAGATNNTTCTLCLEGYFIPAAKRSANVTVAEYGTISCGEIAYAVANNMILDENCSIFATVAQKGCCEPSHTQGTTNAPTPGSSDPIVPDGGQSETKPDGGEGSAAIRVISFRGVVWSIIFSRLSQFLAFS